MRQPESVERGGKPVVDGVDQVDAVAVPLEAFTGLLQRGRVTIERDQAQPGKSPQECVGMPAEPDGRVHEDRVAIGENGGEQLDDPVEQHRDVLWCRHCPSPFLLVHPGEDAADAVRSLSARC